MNILQLLSTYPLWSVILIAVASIIIILKVIEWCKSTWQKRKAFHDTAVHEGEIKQQASDALQAEKLALEKRVKELEENFIKVTTMLEKQQETLDLLIISDELDIKTWIKTQHDKWVPTGAIDGQIFDLVCQRFEIYEREGGNSWAKKLVEDIKKLTIVTNIPLD